LPSVVPFLEDPYEAIRKTCLVKTDTKSKPFEDPVETETPESPHTVASPTLLPDSTPPTCHAEESEDPDTFGARSTSLDSTAPLSPDHSLTHTSPTLVSFLCRITRMAVRVPPAMSPGLSANIADVAAMSDSAFLEDDEEEDEKEEYEEVKESLDFDSESEEEGPTAKDKGPAVGDEGLVVGNEGPCITVESLGLGGDEAISEGQQRAAPVVETAIDVIVFHSTTTLITTYLLKILHHFHFIILESFFMTTSTVISSTDSQMHNNIMGVGSRDRPSMLAIGRYPQWRSRFLRYIGTRPNGEALRKCILSGPYKPTTVLVQAVEETNDSLAIHEHTTVETPMNMTPENKAHFEAEKEAIHLILTGIGDEIYSTVDACQTAQEMWEAIERLQQGMDLAKITRKRPKPDKNDHEIVKSIQNPELKTFSA
nr:hypothetical protein [Tanacetum cinerariifolium]